MLKTLGLCNTRADLTYGIEDKHHEDRACQASMTRQPLWDDSYARKKDEALQEDRMLMNDSPENMRGQQWIRPRL